MTELLNALLLLVGVFFVSAVGSFIGAWMTEKHGKHRGKQNG